MGLRSSWASRIRLLLLVLGLSGLGGALFAEQENEKKGADHAPAAGAAKEAGHGAQGAESHQSGGGEKVNPLKVEPKLAFWTLVLFVGLMTVLGKYAWKPLLAALHAREEHLEHVLKETERARNESEAILAEHRKLLAQAGDEVRGILDRARQDAAAAAEAITRQAQAEAEAARDRARRDIAAARDQALGELWDRTAGMAVTVAERVLVRTLGDSDQKQLFEAALAELPALANGSGGSKG